MLVGVCRAACPCWLSSHCPFPTSLSLLTALVQAVFESGVEPHGWRWAGQGRGAGDLGSTLVQWLSCRMILGSPGGAMGAVWGHMWGADRDVLPEGVWECATQLRKAKQS